MGGGELGARYLKLGGSYRNISNRKGGGFKNEGGLKIEKGGIKNKVQSKQREILNEKC